MQFAARRVQVELFCFQFSVGWSARAVNHASTAGFLPAKQQLNILAVT